MKQPKHNPPPWQPERPLSATQLAHYVTLRGRCERFLQFTLFPSRCETLLQRYGVQRETLSALLAESGNVFEREAVAALAGNEQITDLQNKGAGAFVAALRRQPVGRALYYQVKLVGQLGALACDGIADLIEITRGAADTVDAVVIDIKASRRESIAFRLQIAFYARLLKAALAEAGLQARNLRGAVVARDSELSGPAFETFELDLYEDEIERLVAAPQAEVARVAAKSFAEASYCLSAKCDGCQFNAVCFIETAEREDLSLVPLLTATEKRALQSGGIQSARELATLMNYGQGALTPAPERADVVARLGQRWPLGGRLPLLAQRARAALKHYDARIEAKSFLLGSGFGSLPDPQTHPDLVKVFIDAQRDYLEDRLYLLAALVVAPDKTIEVVELTEAPPDTEAEKNLLIAWLTRLLPAINAAAGVETAPLHVYLFDRRDQRVLLDALTRHFDALCAIPAFYDLLTSSPALTQGMISFLADEVRERRNLSAICQNLYRVASELGFVWRAEELDFWQRFRARAFGYRHAFVRDAQTGLFNRAQHKDAAGVLQVEAAARFGTQIPLEYAYAAWGKLRESDALDPDERKQLRGFLGVTLDELRRLAAHRCRALHHIEQQFARKNRLVEKTPLDLARLDQVEVEPHEVPLHRSLEDFLLLEHHARHQAALLYLSQPPELRAQTGSTTLLRCEQYTAGDGVDYGRFGFARSDGTPLSRRELGDLRLQEGAWVVLNPLRNEEGLARSASQIIRGRLCVIESVIETGMELRLLRMNFKNSCFRYPHRNVVPQPGAVYTLDEMVDDLNADKYLEACRHTADNHLYHWLNEAYRAPQAAKPERLIRPSRLRAARELTELAAQAQQPYGLTAAQRAIVGERFTERALIVQGPPGTGKSHTLGLAILARMLALKSAARPFRVAVAAKTHAAVDESFRIPAEIADFLGQHVYARDGINYRSNNRQRLPVAVADETWVTTALAPEHPLVLIEHDEAGSQQANECEALVIERLAQAVASQLQLDTERGLGIVVPHRAQKALLARRLPELAAAIDTVERFQGGERDLIIVSATVSDLEYAQSESEFLLEPRRLTVALSRPKRKLIVLAARTVFTLIPASVDEYERGSLWKRLRRECAGSLLEEATVGAQRLRLFSITRRS